MGTMKRGRAEEEEEDGGGRPMFPRLSVSEAGERGTFRAPPRNKMALYEQLTVPARPAVGSTSSGKGSGFEKNFFPQFFVSPHTPAHLPERFHSHSCDEMNLNITRVESDRRSIKHVDNRTLNATGSVVKCSLPQPHDNSRAKNSSHQKVEDKDDPVLRTFLPSGITEYSRKGTSIVKQERPIPFCTRSPNKNSFTAMNSLLQFPCSNVEQPEKTSTSGLKSIKHILNNDEERSKEKFLFIDPPVKLVSHPGYGEKSVVSSKIAKTSLDQDKQSTSNASWGLWFGNENAGHKSCEDGPQVVSKCLKDSYAVNDDTLRVASESCAQPSQLNICDKPNLSNRGKEQIEEEDANGSIKAGDSEKNDKVSESSLVDCTEISLDDVVGSIDPKHFWEARRSIVNQQRIFAAQVFELHRLIKVQKLIAASPHLLLEDDPCISTSPPKSSTVSLSPDHIVKHTYAPQQTSQSTERPKENSIQTAPVPSREEGLSKGLPGQLPRSGAFSGNPPAVPMTQSNRTSSWCVPPQNQWLIPVMSPSEGLVYKPYTGPCPPTAGFVAPVYGSCAHLSQPPVAGDFGNTPYGFPASHQQQNMNVSVLSGTHPHYFGAGLPIANPIMSASAVERVIPLAGSHPRGQAEQHSRSSCNMPHPKSEVFSGYPWGFQASKESELQGSTASSPCEKARERRDTLPLFPMSQTPDMSIQPSPSCGPLNQTRAIKVVPRNARSATASAARIFRSIQEERRQKAHD